MARCENMDISILALDVANAHLRLDPLSLLLAASCLYKLEITFACLAQSRGILIALLYIHLSIIQGLILTVHHFFGRNLLHEQIASHQLLQVFTIIIFGVDVSGIIRSRNRIDVHECICHFKGFYEQIVQADTSPQSHIFSICLQCLVSRSEARVRKSEERNLMTSLRKRVGNAIDMIQDIEKRIEAIALIATTLGDKV